MGAVFLLPESLPPQRRKRHSVATTIGLYKGLFSHREFMVHTLTIGLGCAGIFAYVGGSPGLFIETYHISPQYFGIFFGANAFCLIGMSQVNSYLSHRMDPRIILSRALAVSWIACAVLLVFFLTAWGGLWTVYPCLFVFMGSFGFIFPNSMVLAMSPHGENAGNASAFLGCFQFLISALGGIIVTNLPFSVSVSMGVFMTVSMGLILVIRFLAGVTAQTEAPVSEPLADLLNKDIIE